MISEQGPLTGYTVSETSFMMKNPALTHWIQEVFLFNDTSEPPSEILELACGFSDWLSLIQDDHLSELLRLVSLRAIQWSDLPNPLSWAVACISAFEEIDERRARDVFNFTLSDSVEQVLRSHIIRDAFLDTYTVGIRQKNEAKQIEFLREFCPVLPMGQSAVCGVLGGPLVPEILDPFLGRLLRASLSFEKPWIVIDLTYAEGEPEILSRSVEELLNHELPQDVRLALCGLQNSEDFVLKLKQRGVQTERLFMFQGVLPFLRQHP